MQTPFFVIGAPRSGTTMLQMALNRHSQVVIPPETHFFTLLLRSRRGQHRHWQRIEKDLQIRIDPPKHRLRPGPEAEREFWRIAEAYLDRLAKPWVTHVGEKSPEHQLRVPQILATFPLAKFVLIYRDGRDVAASLTKVPWMPKDLELNFIVWLHYYRIQRRLLQREPQRVFCVRYEDLVQNPRDELPPILEFLGLDVEPQVAEGFGNHDGVAAHELSYKGRALEPISPHRIGTWRRELSQRQVRRLERWGGWALRELHYECLTDGKGILPLLPLPLAYARLAATVAVRSVQRQIDELCGTCLYWPNRIARDLPEPEPLAPSSRETASADSGGLQATRYA